MTTAELKEEVVRRSVATGNNKYPHPNKWTVTTAMNWLNENPIKSDQEVAFIKTNISRRVEIAQRAALEPVVGRETTALKSGGFGSGS
jgi:hypothetical protein